MDTRFLWLLVAQWVAVGLCRRTPAPGTCTYSKVYNMFGADCSAINLIQIPLSLNKDIEILDASVNRIRILKNSSFAGLVYLKYLYLADNPIAVIEAGAFENLTELEVLDLSLNSIRTLPSALPATLRKLYLADNPLVEVHLEAAVSLQYLTLADCFLPELPNLGILPNLHELNLTGNPLRSLNVSQLATLCNLQSLALPNALLDPTYLSSCDCSEVRLWIEQHYIFVKPTFNCTVDELTDCPGNSTESQDAYQLCQVAFEKQAGSQHLVAVGAGLGLLVAASLLTILWTRRKKRPPPEPPRPAKLLPESTTKPRF